MTGDLRPIGIYPGPVPGIVLLRFNPGPFAIKRVFSDPPRTPTILEALLRVSPLTPTLVQIERFVVGDWASHSSTLGAGEVTCELVGALR